MFFLDYEKFKVKREDKNCSFARWIELKSFRIIEIDFFKNGIIFRRQNKTICLGYKNVIEIIFVERYGFFSLKPY